MNMGNEPDNEKDYRNEIFVLKVVFKLLICIIGLFGNFIVISIVVIMKKYKKSVTHWYVLQLAFADSLFLLTLPFKVSQDLSNGWIYSNSACKAVLTILYMNYYASTFFLMILSAKMDQESYCDWSTLILLVTTNELHLQLFSLIIAIASISKGFATVILQFLNGNVFGPFDVKTANLGRSVCQIMSIDRYIAVCHSFSDTLQRLRKRRIPYFVIVPSTWIIAILLCIPVMLYSHKAGVSPNCKCVHYYPREINNTEQCIGEGFTSTEDIKACLEFLSSYDDVNPNEPHCRTIKDPEYSEFPYYSGFYDYNSTSMHNEFYAEEGSSQYGYEDFNRGLNNDNKTLSKINPNCHYWKSPKEWINFIIFNFVVMFIFPVLVMAICYGLIVLKFSFLGIAYPKSMGTSNCSPSSSRVGEKRKIAQSSFVSEQDRRRVTFMCAVLVSFFIICWLPFHSVHLAKIVGIPSEDGRICNILPTVCSLLAYLNSALNPFLYGFLSNNLCRVQKKATTENDVTRLETCISPDVCDLSRNGIGYLHREVASTTSNDVIVVDSALQKYAFSERKDEKMANGEE